MSLIGKTSCHANAHYSEIIYTFITIPISIALIFFAFLFDFGLGGGDENQ